jgi:alpha/beta superfamily hydrolase
MKVAFAEVLREPLILQTSDRLFLEAELATPDQPTSAAVLTHPNPPDGGNMRSFVPGELFRALPDREVATLRFNFRGVGKSEGQFDGGRSERQDVLAAIGAIEEITEGLPLGIYGSSFGADTALTVTHPSISGWCLCAPPLRDEKLHSMSEVSRDPRPKLLIVAERDQLRSPESVAEVTSGWTNTTIEVIPGADHFFVGRIPLVVAACERFADQLLQS